MPLLSWLQNCLLVLYIPVIRSWLAPWTDLNLSLLTPFHLRSSLYVHPSKDYPSFKSPLKFCSRKPPVNPLLLYLLPMAKWSTVQTSSTICVSFIACINSCLVLPFQYILLRAEFTQLSAFISMVLNFMWWQLGWAIVSGYLVKLYFGCFCEVFWMRLTFKSVDSE